jgi:two-component system, cell cycle sensor histidine kinase and response regulator CckA
LRSIWSRTTAARGAGLVRQILGIARGVGGKFQIVRLGDLVRDIAVVIEASFPRSIVLETVNPDDLWPILANPTQIHQVLLNLAVNARDAMLPGGGKLRVFAVNRVVENPSAFMTEGVRPGAFIVIEVSDTGMGIKPELLARIWDPFFTTKDVGSGTGLGLSTVRGIVAAHGGFVTVATLIGRGTTFGVFLPAAKPQEGANPSAYPGIAQHAGDG